LSKLTPKNLARGTVLTHTQVYDNLETVNSAIHGLRAGATVYLDNDNKKFTKGRFTLTWNMGTVVGKVRNYFNTPLPQEWFLPSHEPTVNTPTIRMSSLCLSWDRGGQQAARVVKGVGTAPALLQNYRYKLQETPDEVAYVRIYQAGSVDERVIAEVQISKEEYGLLADETDFIDIMPKFKLLNITIDPYKPYIVEVQSPFTAHPIYSVVIKAEFEHELVERDHAALKKYDTTPLAPRNLPLHNNTRVASHSALTAPASGDSIDATGAKGVQTQIEVLDTSVNKRLKGGLDRYSRILHNEHILEDQNYFAMVVPLFNFEDEVNSANITNYTKAQQGASRTDTFTLWDRAIIPIVFPMTVHHVQLSFDTTPLTIGSFPLANRGLEVGVASSFQITDWGPRVYTQIARTPAAFSLSNTANKISNVGLWSVPLSYPGTPDGIGWHAQGRPIFTGLELGNQNETGVLQRSQTPDASNGSSLINPPTNGAEQFIEVRAVLKALDGSALTASSLGTYTAFPRGGVFVHIYGKSALTE
jgi:hypothetical protein